MTVPPEKLHELLNYCMTFATQMLGDAGDFYPFGATIGQDNTVAAVGGFDGNERPSPQDIYKLLSDGFVRDACNGTIIAAALAANVNIPPQYEPPVPDGIRVHLEGTGFARFIYVPYTMKKTGFIKKSILCKLLEPIAVEIDSVFFNGDDA